MPFDSEYKFMATFHDRPDWIAGGVLREPHVVSVKGAPDVIIERCATALWHGEQVPIAQVRDELLDANRQLSERGLRVLGFAIRDLPSDAMTAALDDPMGEMHDLILISLVGIIDPLRAEAVEAVRIAHQAGIDVRMITGDHTVTARAIADELGLGPGVITGTDLSHLSDEQVIAQLPQLHVFGRVAPEDKVRLARLMQEAGEVVAMTGDAVNDAAALKQADVGVAMGSGSEVTKQAGKLVLTDDNFATLVKAVEYGRDIYRRISSYVKLQLTILSSVLQLMLYATILNINGGVALFPMQLLFAKFFVVVTVVIGFIVDVPDPGVMQRPPRTPGSRIATRAQTVRWAITGFIISALALMVLAWGPDEPSTTDPSVSMTMAFASGRAQRRQQRPRDAPRARTVVVGTDVPLPRMDHPGVDPHLGRGRAEHAPAPPRHGAAHRRPMGPRHRTVARRPGIHRDRQSHPSPPAQRFTARHLIRPSDRATWSGDAGERVFNECSSTGDTHTRKG